MVKIDTINFGVLISRIATLTGNEMYHGTVTDIYDLVKLCVVEDPPVQPFTPSVIMLDELLAAVRTNQLIPAIKAYRSMTGYGLKEAKEAIDRNWPHVRPMPVEGNQSWPYKPE